MTSTRNEHNTLHPNNRGHNLHGSLSDEMQICIQNCLRCSQVCAQTIQHCLRRGGQHASPDLIRLLQDCIEACQLAANFMSRDSYFYSKACETSAVICLACFIECDRMGDDQLLKMCAEVCRRCAESCNQMIPQH